MNNIYDNTVDIAGLNMVSIRITCLTKIFDKITEFTMAVSI